MNLIKYLDAKKFEQIDVQFATYEFWMRPTQIYHLTRRKIIKCNYGCKLKLANIKNWSNLVENCCIIKVAIKILSCEVKKNVYHTETLLKLLEMDVRLTYFILIWKINK